MRTPNARPEKCELCNARLPVDGTGRVRSKQVIVRSAHNTPLNLCACRACHWGWLHPNPHPLQPALAL